MVNTLILLTNYYPYYKGEEYLESEIAYLAEAYNRIVIIATMISSGSPQTRQIPANCYAYPSGVKHTLSGKVRMLLRNSISGYKSMKYSVPISEKNRPIKWLYSHYFETRFRSIYPQVCNILDSCNVKSNNVTIYSYWLYETARVAVALKEDYFNECDVFTFSRAHRYDVDVEASPLNFLPLRTKLLHGLDRIYPVTSPQVEYYRKYYPQYADKIELRTLGTSVQVPIEYLGRKESFIVVSCSALRKIKRIDLLISSLAVFQKNAPDRQIEWHHFGTGPEGAKLEKLAKSSLRAGSYEFMGHIPNQQLLSWYREHTPDLIINVSSSEGVPVSLMEAASLGMPAIATDVGGNRDIVQDKHNGFLLPPNPSPEAICEAIMKIYQLEPQEYKILSDNSVKIWDDSFNAEIVYKNFVRNIKSMTMIK